MVMGAYSIRPFRVSVTVRALWVMAALKVAATVGAVSTPLSSSAPLRLCEKEKKGAPYRYSLRE